MSDWPHALQHTRLPCPSLSPRVCSNSCWLSWWCHPTISSSVAPFSFSPQSFPASGSFPMSQLFTSGGQSIGTSASASVHLMNIQGWFLLELTALISLLSKGPSRVCSSTIVKESACNAGDLGLIPGSERSSWEGNGSPLQYSCLENSLDRGAWWAIVHGVTKSWAWPND